MFANATQLWKTVRSIGKTHGGKGARWAGRAMFGGVMYLGGAYTLGDRDLTNAQTVLEEVKNRAVPAVQASELSKKALSARLAAKKSGSSLVVYDAQTAAMCLKLIEARNEQKMLKLKRGEFEKFATYDAKGREKYLQTIDGVLGFVASGLEVELDDNESKPAPHGWASHPLHQEDALTLELMNAAVKARATTKTTFTTASEPAEKRRQKTITNLYRQLARFAVARMDDLATYNVEASSALAELPYRKDRVTKKGRVHSDFVRQFTMPIDKITEMPTPLLWYHVEVHPERFADTSTVPFEKTIRGAAAACAKSGSSVRILLVQQSDASESVMRGAREAARRIDDVVHKAQSAGGSDTPYGTYARVLKRSSDYARQPGAPRADLLFLFDPEHGGGEFVLKRLGAAYVDTGAKKGMPANFVPAGREIKFGNDARILREEFMRCWDRAGDA